MASQALRACARQGVLHIVSYYYGANLKIYYVLVV